MLLWGGVEGNIAFQPLVSTFPVYIELDYRTMHVYPNCTTNGLTLLSKQGYKPKKGATCVFPSHTRVGF
jgi:hypothetical protein